MAVGTSVMSSCVAPGTWRMNGEFGLRASMVEDAGCAAVNDGVRLSIDRRSDTGETETLAVFDIDPLRVVTDRGAQPFEVSANVREGDQLVVNLEPGPPGSQTSCDWSYLRDVRLSQVDAPDGVASDVD